MAVTLYIKRSSDLNLEDRVSLNRKTLSREVAEARLAILARQQQELNSQDLELTPRRADELNQLIEALDNSPDFLVKIKTGRGALEYYNVELKVDPNKRRVQLLEANKEIIPSIPSQERAIVTAIVQPTENVLWYKEQTTAHMLTILGSDFLDALKHSCLANLSLMSAAMNLTAQPIIFGKILNLHQRSTYTYTCQIAFNREMETVLLQHSEWVHQSLRKLQGYLEDVGNFSNLPEGLLEKVSNIAVEESKLSIEMYDKIARSAQKFLEELGSLEEGMKLCIESITNSNQRLTDLIFRLGQLYSRKEELKSNELELKRQQEQYRELKEKEVEGRKIEKIGGTSITILGIPIYSREPTLVCLEPDYGSKVSLQSLNQINEDNAKIKKEIDELESNLAPRIEESMRLLNLSPESTKEASSSLSAAITAIHQLQQAIGIRKRNAESESMLLKQKLESQANSMNSIDDIFDLLGILKNKILCQHAIWLQSNKQCNTIKVIREEETKILMQVQEDISKNTESGKQQIKDVISTITGDITKKMITNEDLLKSFNE